MHPFNSRFIKRDESKTPNSLNTNKNLNAGIRDVHFAESGSSLATKLLPRPTVAFTRLGRRPQAPVTGSQEAERIGKYLTTFDTAGLKNPKSFNFSSAKSRLSGSRPIGPKLSTQILLGKVHKDMMAKKRQLEMGGKSSDGTFLSRGQMSQNVSRPGRKAPPAFNKLLLQALEACSKEKPNGVTFQSLITHIRENNKMTYSQNHFLETNINKELNQMLLRGQVSQFNAMGGSSGNFSFRDSGFTKLEMPSPGSPLGSVTNFQSCPEPPPNSVCGGQSTKNLTSVTAYYEHQRARMFPTRPTVAKFNAKSRNSNLPLHVMKLRERFGVSRVGYPFRSEKNPTHFQQINVSPETRSYCLDLDINEDSAMRVPNGGNLNVFHTCAGRPVNNAKKMLMKYQLKTGVPGFNRKPNAVTTSTVARYGKNSRFFTEEARIKAQEDERSDRLELELTLIDLILDHKNSTFSLAKCPRTHLRSPQPVDSASDSVTEESMVSILTFEKSEPKILKGVKDFTHFTGKVSEFLRAQDEEIVREAKNNDNAYLRIDTFCDFEPNEQQQEQQQELMRKHGASNVLDSVSSLMVGYRPRQRNYKLDQCHQSVSPVVQLQKQMNFTSKYQTEKPKLQRCFN